MSVPPGTEMFQFPGFASPAYGFSRRYPKGVGCPIRIPTDQRLLAAPRGFSQRATSFIASWCQGIHRMPFSRSRSNPPCTGASHTQGCEPLRARRATKADPSNEWINPSGPYRRCPIRSLRHSAHNRVRSPRRAGRSRSQPTRQTNPNASEHEPWHRTELAPQSGQYRATTRPETHQNLMNNSERTTTPRPTTGTPNAIARRPFPGDAAQRRNSLLLCDETPNQTQWRHAMETRNGDDRDRTGDPLLAKQVLSQLSYAPSGT